MIAALGFGLGSLVALLTAGSWRRASLLALVAAAWAAATYAARRTGPAGVGFLLLILGLVGLPAGALGLRHLLVAGLTGTALAGLLCLVAALVLLVQGAAILLAVTPRWRRLLWLPAGLAVLLLVVYPLSCAAIATNIPPTELSSRTPADLGLTYQEVQLETDDGVGLAGWYIPSTNRAAVILLHGAGDSTRSDVLAHAAVLAGHGYGVLLMDARGHGHSGGRGMDFGWHGETDVRAAVDYLAGRAEIQPGRLAVVGLSMGAEQALTAAGSDQRLGAVVAEGATKRVLADNGWLPSHPGRYINLAIDWLLFEACRLLGDAEPPPPLKDAVVATAPRRVLLITGEKVPDEARAAAYFQQAAPENVTLWEVRGAGHTAGLATAPREWEERVVGFLDSALGL